MTATFILYASKVKFEMCSLNIDAPLCGKICIISQPTSIMTYLNEQWAITLQDDFDHFGTSVGQIGVKNCYV